MMSVTDILARNEAQTTAREAGKAEAARQHNANHDAREKAAKGQILKIDPSRLVGVIDPERFDCESVYRVFHALTFEWRVQDREVTWFDLIGRIVPGKYQFLFTESDWRRVYVEFTGRTEFSNEKNGQTSFLI